LIEELTPALFHQTAIQSKKKDIVRLLLRQSGIDLLCTTEDGLSALHLASAVQDMEDIATELLAKNNSNVNAETITGKTALNFAARHRRWNLSASLIAEFVGKTTTIH
jgi:ankyrin repeat protein